MAQQLQISCSQSLIKANIHSSFSSSSTSTQGNDNVCPHYFYINVYSHAIQNNSKMEKKKKQISIKTLTTSGMPIQWNATQL